MLFSNIFSDKKSEYRRNYTELVINIENDIREFVEQELIVYNRNPNNKNLSDSVIANLALFDLEQLKTENGVAQIRNLFSDHHNQIVNHRLKHVLSTIYIRYGVKAVDEIAENTLTIIGGVYNIDKNIIKALDNEIITFWLQPFIRKTWDEMFNVITTEKSNKEEK